MPPTPAQILAVDDDREDLELVEEALLALEPSVQVSKLSNGSEVLPYLDQLGNDDLPCMIILDYNMPEMTGAQVIDELCRHPRYAPIPKIILSTSNSPFHIRECMNKGAAKYFVKPNNLMELNKLVRDILACCSLFN